MSLVTSILRGGTNSHTTTSEEANAVYTDFVNEGIVGTVGNTASAAPMTGGFGVNAQGTPDTTVAVSAGVAYVEGTPTSQNAQTFRVNNSASTNVTISANSSGSTKYDWLYISLDATNLNNPNTAADNVATLTTSRSSSSATDDGTPPTYGYAIAVITVANGFTSITNGNIRDLRTQVLLDTGTSSSTSGWTSITTAPTTVTALGNRSYTVLFPSVDLTSTLSNGMRIKTTRSVAAPTQCTSLNGTNQYYSKTSPAGMTFTDDFVVSAWIKVSAYGTNVIASRYNGTSGFQFYITSGQVYLVGYNGGSGNFSAVSSYQSVPLNKWVHVTAQLDMSSFTATTTTSYVMIDGVDVPASVTRGGTNPTLLAQAGNLEIGGGNGGTSPFSGKIAQVAIYNAKVTQATILASMHQTLAGTETSLISAYSFNNTINDLSTNANNLTANGSATATNADSPFGGQADGTISSTLDYAIITKTAFSTNTTLTVQVPEGCTIPTSGGVSSVSYSTQGIPYGFPKQGNKWQIGTFLKVDNAQSSPVANTWYNLGQNLNIPIGEWQVWYEAPGIISNSTNANIIQATLSTANNTESDSFTTAHAQANITTALACTLRKTTNVSLSAATPYYLNFRTTSASGVTLTMGATSDGGGMIIAECKHL